LAAKKGSVPKIPWDDVRRREKQDTIEHILPQNPPTCGYWTERFDFNARLQYTNDLGNLCLTKDNAAYGNKPFPDKRGSLNSRGPCYAQSPFFMERELAKLEDWNPVAVQERKERLVAWALERWMVDVEPAAAATSMANEAEEYDENLPWSDTNDDSAE
jgi:hypothetical protein